MKPWKITALSLLCMNLAFADPFCPSQNLVQQTAESFFKSTPHSVGLSVTVVHPGCEDVTVSLGTADISKHKPMTNLTTLVMASNSKPILMVIILQLMHDHPQSFPNGLETKLTDIRDYLDKPIFEANGQIVSINHDHYDVNDKRLHCDKPRDKACIDFSTIDVRHLLMESSGISDYIRESDTMFDYIRNKLTHPTHDDPLLYEDDLDALRLMGLRKKAEPDPIIPTQSHNTDASLLAIIAERVGFTTLTDLLEQYVLTPLNLSNKAMFYLDSPYRLSAHMARRYALLNTDDVITEAIKEHTLLSSVTNEMADFFRPSSFTAFGRHLDTLPDGTPVFDVLKVQGQGLIGFPGPAGIVSTTSAISHVFDDLSEGHRLLNPLQKDMLLASSFQPVPPVIAGYDARIGFGSLTALHNNDDALLMHAGFVFGGESLVVHSYTTHTTIALASNSSGAWQSKLPGFYVTPTPNLDQAALWELSQRLFKLYTNSTH